MDRTKKVLVTLLVIGAIASVGVGTYATFNAQTTNAGNTFTTGTLALSDAKSGGTTCYSAGAAPNTTTPPTIAGNLGTNANSAGCDTIATATLAEPGSSAQATFTLTNVGSLNSSTGLFLSMPASGTGSCANSAAAGAAYTGGGNLCGDLYVSVQDTGTNTCMMPVVAGACGSNSVALSTLTTPQNLYTTFNAGVSKSLLVTITMKDNGPGADNALQGMTSTFSLNWTIAQ